VSISQSAKGRQKSPARTATTDPLSQVKFLGGASILPFALVHRPTLVVLPFLGGTGTGGDLAKAIAVDNTGNAYMARTTPLPILPPTGRLRSNLTTPASAQAPLHQQSSAYGSGPDLFTYRARHGRPEELALGVA